MQGMLMLPSTVAMVAAVNPLRVKFSLWVADAATVLPLFTEKGYFQTQFARLTPASSFSLYG